MTARVPLRPVLAALTEGRTFEVLQPKAVKGEQKILREDGRRMNGRRPEELPPLFFFVNPHPVHNGSAVFSMGRTQVSAAVSGPNPRVLQQTRTSSSVLNGRAGTSVTAASRVDASIELLLQFASFAESSSSSLTSFLSGCIQTFPTSLDDQLAEDQEVRALGESVMEAVRSCVRTTAYPSTTIEIYVLVLSHDGHLFPAIVNAVCLALMDARIAMWDTMAAAVCSIVEMPGQTPICIGGLESDELEKIKEEGGATTSINLAMFINKGTVAYIEMVGTHLKSPHDQELIQLAESACVAIGNELGHCMLSNMKTTTMQT